MSSMELEKCQVCGQDECDLYLCADCGIHGCDDCVSWYCQEHDDLDGDYFCEECAEPTPSIGNIIRRLTGLNFCDDNCGCGENNHLWWFPVGGEPESWVPAWMNGADTESVWQWLVENRLGEGSYLDDRA